MSWRCGRPSAIHGSADLGIRAYALVAQLVEHVLGKDGVTGSNPVEGSKQACAQEGIAPVLDNYLRLELLDTNGANCINLRSN
jgi:hypothetical protein